MINSPDCESAKLKVTLLFKSGLSYQVQVAPEDIEFVVEAVEKRQGISLDQLFTASEGTPHLLTTTVIDGASVDAVLIDYPQDYVDSLGDSDEEGGPYYDKES